MVRVALLVFLVLLAACGGSKLLPIGAQAPDIVGKDVEGKVTRLSERRGHKSVVFFYPKDGTPGCTKEACAFRDAWKKYDAAGVTVFGVSRDSEASHMSFAREHKLPFPLVADTDGSVAASYGVGNFLGMSSRVTFLVGQDGKIVRVWPDVDPAVHADQVLEGASHADPR